MIWHMRDSIEKKSAWKSKKMYIYIYIFFFLNFVSEDWKKKKRFCERRVTIVQSARATIEKVDIFKFPRVCYSFTVNHLQQVESNRTF